MWLCLVNRIGFLSCDLSKNRTGEQLTPPAGARPKWTSYWQQGNRGALKVSVETNEGITCDVLVLGGGLAGVMAAISAAQRGVSVVLQRVYRR